MNPRRAVRVAWQGSSRRPLRTVLTAASLTIGVLTLVVVTSAEALIRQATLRGAVLRDGPPDTVSVQFNPDLGPLPATTEGWWLARLRGITAGQGATVATYDRYPSVNLAESGGVSESVDLVSTGPDLRAIKPYPVIAGQWFAGPTLVPEVVLNRPAAAALAPLTGGYAIEVPDGPGFLRVSVVGVVDDGELTPEAYVPDTAGVALAGAGIDPVVRGILVSGPDLDVARLSGAVSAVGGLTGHAGDIAGVSRVDTVGQYDDQLATQRRLFLGIALLCLVVGALGVMNTGLSALRERAEELSLRRALGASRSGVAVMMMIESQIVALGAAAVAVGAAYLAVPWLVSQLSTVDVGRTAPPVTALAGGVLAGMVAALAGALAPSVRAARLPIAELLR